MKAEDFTRKFTWLKRLFYVALPGILLAIMGGILDLKIMLVCGLLMICPFFVFAYVLTFLHWKHRYIGTSSTLWGVLLAVETSGWFKIVYLFRHILPDIRGTGRYSR